MHNHFNENHQLERVEIHVTNHCNLNCLACAHFSNISQEYNIKIEDFEKDISTLVKKVNYKILNILGGEPLLHPNIDILCEKAREICPDKIITLNTNGILLPNMKKSFWQSLKKNNILIRLSIYPYTIKQGRKLIELILKNDIKIYGLWDGRKFYLRKSKYYQDNIENIWKNCDAKICNQIYKGKLYICPTSAYGLLYNKYFNKNFYFEDGIDIYNHSSSEIYDFLFKASKNCATCINNGRMINWQLSKFNVDEWDV